MEKKVITNTLWLVSFQLIKAIVSFIISVFTARYLGPSNYGIIGYITTFILLFTAVSNLGLGNVVVKEYVQDKEKISSILKTSLILNLIASLLSYIALNIVVYLLNSKDTIIIICSLIQSVSLIFSSFEMINYYYQSQLESKRTVVLSLIAYFLTQLFKVYLLVTNKPIQLFALATSLDCIITGVLLYISMKSNNKLRGGKFDKKIAKNLLKQSAPFILIGSISVIYASADKIMLKHILGDTEQVGYYNVAHTLATSWVFIVSAIITSLSPMIYENYGNNYSQYTKYSRQLYWLTFYIGVFISICLTVVAPFIIPILYSNIYNESILATIFLSWASVFAYLGVARGAQFVCEKKQKYLCIFSILTVLINVSLNALFIPKMQATGAAIATLVSEFFVCMICPLFFKNTREIGKNIWSGVLFKNIEIKSIFSSIFKKIKKNEYKENIENIENKIEKLGEKMDKKLKIVFVSNFMNHHQLEVSKEFLKHSEYKFIATEPIDSDRLKFGYKDMNKEYDFVLCSYDDDVCYNNALNEISEADVVIYGSCPFDMIEKRVAENKLTFAYSERLFKNRKIIRMFHPKIIHSIWNRCTKYRDKKYYLLCASAYSKSDYNWFGAFKNKCYKWGYFPKIQEVKDDKELDQIVEEKNSSNEILWCGRFLKWKHPEYAIMAALYLKKQGVSFHINMVGNGPLLEKMKDKIKKLKLENCIDVLGALPYDKVQEKMRQAKIFLFTSDQGEGWGAVLNESMGNACCVIANKKIGSVPYMLNDTNGYIYTNKKEFYNHLYQAVMDNNKTKELCLNAYKTIHSVWNAENAVNSFLKLVEYINNGESVKSIKSGPCSKA